MGFTFGDSMVGACTAGLIVFGDWVLPFTSGGTDDAAGNAPF